MGESPKATNGAVLLRLMRFLFTPPPPLVSSKLHQQVGSLSKWSRCADQISAEVDYLGRINLRRSATSGKGVKLLKGGNAGALFRARPCTKDSARSKIVHGEVAEWRRLAKCSPWGGQTFSALHHIAGCRKVSV